MGERSLHSLGLPGEQRQARKFPKSYRWQRPPPGLIFLVFLLDYTTKAHTLVSLGKCCFSFLRLCVHAQDRMVCAVSSCFPFLCKFRGLNSGCATSVLTPAEPSVAPEDVSRTCGLIRYEHQACKLSICIHLLKMK